MLNADPRGLVMGLDLDNDGTIDQQMMGPLGVDVDNDGTVDVVVTPEKLLAWALKKGIPLQKKQPVPVPVTPAPTARAVPVEVVRPESPRVVRHVARTPVVIREFHDRPIYFDSEDYAPVSLGAPRQPLVEVRTRQRKATPYVNYPYHDPTPPGSTCDFWGPFQPKAHD